jgi:TIR domain
MRIVNRFISALPSLLDAQAPLRCFISYSVKNERLAERLDADLQKRDIRFWYFRKHALAGGVLATDIADHIDRYDKVILICSKDSLKSPEVLKEVKLALGKESVTGRDVLLPIRIDDAVFQWRHALKKDITAKMIVDFRGWNTKEALYTAAFERLFTAINLAVRKTAKKRRSEAEGQ